MPFSQEQVRKLAAPIRARHVKERQVEGKTLHYVEGWHVVAEANRIFGFDAWDRETLSSQCVWQKQSDHRFGAAYVTRVRVTVRAGENIIVREGLGSGEAFASTAGQAHERAAKAAETDATKRALSTFGNSFGLSLYRDKSEPPKARAARAVRSSEPVARSEPQPAPPLACEAVPGSAAEPQVAPAPQPPDQPERVVASLPVLLPPGYAQDPAPARVEKSELTFGEPRRIRNREHLRFVARQPCLVCGRAPSQAHHLRFAQPRALGRKVSDEFTVPLCALHHHDLHTKGAEVAWWEGRGIDPSPVADDLWRASQSGAASDAAE